jgi:hypothetical protein
MVFPIQQFRPLTMEEVNPQYAGLQMGLKTAGDIFNLGKGAIQFPLDLKKLQEELLKQQILNKYLPQREKAEIGEIGARTGLIGEQTKEKAYERGHDYPQLQETMARTGLLGEQAKALTWQREHGYPTPDIKTMEWIAKHANELMGGGQSDLSQQIASQLPQTHISPIGSTAAQQAAPSMMEQMAQLPKAISSQTQNAALDNGIYFGTPPQIGIDIPGNPLLSNKINQLFPDPLAQTKRQEYQQDVKGQIDEYRDIFKKTTPAAESANDTIQTSNSLMDAYNRITFAKGRVGSWIPAISDAATLFEREKEAMINGIAAGFASGRGGVTQADFAAAKGSKIGRDMPEDSFIRLNNTYKGNAQNDIEHDAFMRAAANRKIRTDVAVPAWNAYRQARPVMNQGKGEIYFNNGYQNSWQDYLTPEALRSIAQTGQYKAPNQQQLKAQNIKNEDINNFSKEFKISKIDAIKAIQDPAEFMLRHDKKDLKKIPTRILVEMVKNQHKEGVV